MRLQCFFLLRGRPVLVANLAPSDIVLNIRIHAWPVDRLPGSTQCSGDTHMHRMKLGQNVLSHGSWNKASIAFVNDVVLSY